MATLTPHCRFGNSHPGARIGNRLKIIRPHRCAYSIKCKLYTVSQLKWRQNLNPLKHDMAQRRYVPFNYIYCYIFNVICNSFIKLYTLVSEIWKFKDHQFVSQVEWSDWPCRTGSRPIGLSFGRHRGDTLFWCTCSLGGQEPCLKIIVCPSAPMNASWRRTSLRTGRTAVWGTDSGEPVKPCIGWGGSLRGRSNFGGTCPAPWRSMGNTQRKHALSIGANHLLFVLGGGS